MKGAPRLPDSLSCVDSSQKGEDKSEERTIGIAKVNLIGSDGVKTKFKNIMKQINFKQLLCRRDIQKTLTILSGLLSVKAGRG